MLQAQNAVQCVSKYHDHRRRISQEIEALFRKQTLVELTDIPEKPTGPNFDKSTAAIKVLHGGPRSARRTHFRQLTTLILHKPFATSTNKPQKTSLSSPNTQTTD